MGNFSVCVPDAGTTVRVAMNVMTLGDPAVPVDPETIFLFIKDPEGIETSQTTTRDKLGEFHAEVVVPIAGQWRYRFETTGPVRVKEGSFVIRHSMFDSVPIVTEHLEWGDFQAYEWKNLNVLTWGKLSDTDHLTWSVFAEILWENFDELEWKDF